MRKNRRGVSLAVGALAAAVGCGSVSDNHPAPMLVSGGAIGGGGIDGYLNVYVIDADTNAVISPETADSTGLAIFDPTACAGLRGKVTVTASASGYAPTTWIGADGANMTIN